MLGDLKSCVTKVPWESPLHAVASPGMSGEGGLGLRLVTLKHPVSLKHSVFCRWDNPPSIE